MSAPAGSDDRPGRGADVLIVSLGSTAGWRAADAELAAGLRAAGLRVAVAAAQPPRSVRTFMLTDLLWALAARRAAQQAIRAEQPHAIVYCTSTAALLWPRPGAIRFDTPARTNRPGRHGLWQRFLERRRMREAPLLLPMSAEGLRECPGEPERERPPGRPGGRCVVVPMSISTDRDGPPQGQERDIAAVAYGANPAKKGIDRVLKAWSRAARAGEVLCLAGCEPEELRAAGIAGVESLPGVRLVGKLPREQYRALLRRAHVFICAPRHEDYGIAQLEALADGCMLVSTPASGPYVAYEIGRGLDTRLLGEDLARSLRTALDHPMPDYRERAAQALQQFSPASVQRIIASDLLPALSRMADS